MSRCNDDYDDYDPLMAGRWERNTKLAINGKRGQKVLRELEAALLALPEPKLAEETFLRRGSEEDPVECCILGALALARGIETPRHLNDPEDGYVDEAAAWAKQNLRMTFTLAWNLVWQNDEGRARIQMPDGTYRKITDEERYTFMLEWLRKKIQPVVPA